jgi:hypothetical protein
MAPQREMAEEDTAAVDVEFKPNLRFYITFITLSVVTLAAALDATSMFRIPTARCQTEVMQ